MSCVGAKFKLSCMSLNNIIMCSNNLDIKWRKYVIYATSCILSFFFIQLSASAQFVDVSNDSCPAGSFKPNVQVIFISVKPEPSITSNLLFA